MLKFDRKQQNSVKQLSFNKKNERNTWERTVLEGQALCTFKVCLVLARFWLCSESKSISLSVMSNSL